MQIGTETLLDDLQRCVLHGIAPAGQDVHVMLQTPEQEHVILACTQATILHDGGMLANLPHQAEWARTIDWAEVFGADMLGLTFANGTQLFIQMTAAHLIRCHSA
ncbi:MAG: hypothetical protein ABI901_09890 [Roseiflexaceae bacterium]